MSDDPSNRTPRLDATPASSIEMRPIPWLWEGRLAQGSLALLVGKEWVGRLAFAYGLAADLTKGRTPGALEGTPKSVLVATEGSWERTIVPRLVSANADLTRVSLIGDLPRDLGELERLIEHDDVAMVLLDLSLLDLDVELQQALRPLVSLADRTDTVIMGVADSRSRGTSAFKDVAHSVIRVEVDPSDGRRYLLGQANDLGCLPTLLFHIERENAADGIAARKRVSWDGTNNRDIDAILIGGHKDEIVEILRKAKSGTMTMTSALRLVRGSDEKHKRRAFDELAASGRIYVDTVDKTRYGETRYWAVRDDRETLRACP